MPTSLSILIIYDPAADSHAHESISPEGPIHYSLVFDSLVFDILVTVSLAMERLFHNCFACVILKSDGLAPVSFAPYTPKPDSILPDTLSCETISTDSLAHEYLAPVFSKII